MTPITTGQMSALTNLGVLLRAVWNDQLNMQPAANLSVLNLYNVQESRDAQEVNQGVGGMGDPQKFTGTIDYETFELLYQKTYVHDQYAQGLAIQRALVDDEKYGVIRRQTEMMTTSFNRGVYKMAASTFNNGFSSSYLGPDGKALFATDHPYSPTNTTTQSNKGTSALSHASVEATRLLMMGFKDSKGNVMNIMPDTLIVPIALSTTAQVIVNSDKRSGVANNDTNINNGYRIVVDPYLTDSNNWFMVDSFSTRMFLNWFWRVRPEFTNDPTSDFNLVYRYRGYMRCSYGWDTWQFGYGHEVA